MRDFIEEQAVDFSNRKYFGFTAAVHLEDSEDERFWDAMVQSIKPGKYDYVYYSKSKKGNDTKGCEQCLQFMPYLNKDFFVCIDSDLRFLLKEVDICKERYVAQTYTYSWESHFCIGKKLDDLLLAKFPDLCGNFNFEIFLANFSKVVYKPLLFLLYLKKNDVVGDFEKQFNACLPKQCTRAGFENNACGLVEGMEKNLTLLCEANPYWAGFEADAETANFDLSFLAGDNAYLFVRGHNVFELILYIGKKFLCKDAGASFYNDILLDSFDVDGSYAELDAIKRDLEFILT